MGDPLSCQLSDEAMRQSGELQRRLVEMMRAATALEQRALADAYKVEVLRAHAREIESLRQRVEAAEGLLREANEWLLVGEGISLDYYPVMFGQSDLAARIERSIAPIDAAISAEREG